MLTDDLIRRLKPRCAYLTLGVDTKKATSSKARGSFGQPHAELVCLVDMKTGSLHWTGKFWPVQRQQKTNVRLPDPDNHFVSLDGTPVLILGCYDLSVCSPSWQATPVWRQTAVSQFRALAAQHEPVAVLHQPHTPVTIGTWAWHWQSLLKELPFVTDYLGARPTPTVIPAGTTRYLGRSLACHAARRDLERCGPAEPRLVSGKCSITTQIRNSESEMESREPERMPGKGRRIENGQCFRMRSFR